MTTHPGRALVTCPCDRRWLLLLALVATAACGRPRSPADEAADMERSRCGPDVDEAQLSPLFDGSAIDRVEALQEDVTSADYLVVHDEVLGAVIFVRAMKGVTPEWLDRALECHSARRVLGRVADIPGDPFWLPGRTVSIDVRSARDELRVEVRGDTQADGEAILARARAFVGTP